MTNRQRRTLPSGGSVGRGRGRIPKRISLKQLDHLHREFLEYARLADSKSSWTLRNYHHAFLNFRRQVEEDEGDQRIELAAWSVDDWKIWNAKRNPGLASSSIHTYWRHLRSFFKHLEWSKGLPSPFTDQRPPQLPTTVPRAKRPADCNQILRAAGNHPTWNAFDRGRNKAVLACALYAGLRRSELLALSFMDVDLVDGTLIVRRGKGRGGGKDRVVMIAPSLAEILSDYLVERSRRRITAPAFFCTWQTRQGMSMSTLRRIVTRVREASGVPFSLHALRHSFITQLLRAGVPIHTAGALAGHTQITTTANYVKVWDEDKREAVKRLEFV